MMMQRFEPLVYLMKTGLPELGERSWNEIGNDRDILKYDPDWAQYAQMESNNVLRFFALRDESENLVGYASVILLNNLHDRKILCAYVQDLYIEPEHRKGYMAFRDFYNTLEGHLKGIGVKHITMGERENDPRGGVGAVYKRLGFDSCERLWTKGI